MKVEYVESARKYNYNGGKYASHSFLKVRNFLAWLQSEIKYSLSLSVTVFDSFVPNKNGVNTILPEPAI